MELAAAHGVDDVFVQHQVIRVALGDDDTLVALEAPFLANPEEALDLFVHAADRLHVAFLVDRTCHGDVLLDGHTGETGDDGVEFCRGRAVAVDRTV